jgi:hypothetical protein
LWLLYFRKNRNLKPLRQIAAVMSAINSPGGAKRFASVELRGRGASCAMREVAHRVEQSPGALGLGAVWLALNKIPPGSAWDCGMEMPYEARVPPSKFRAARD